MDLKHLSHLIALADEGRFVAAAEKVHLSQAAFSRSIQSLEHSLGLRLFDRGPRGATQTPAGRIVVERARKLLFDSHCMSRDIELYLKKQIGDLALGVGPFPAATLMPALMPELRRQFPGVRIRIEVNNWMFLSQNLKSELLDFFVADVRDLPVNPDFEISMLARQFGGFYVRGDHPLLTEKSLTPEAILPFGIATVRLPRPIQSALTNLLGVAGDAVLPIALECDDVALLKQTAMATDTVLVMTHATVVHELAAGTLVLLPLKDLPPLHTAMGIVSLKGRSHSPIALHVIDRLKEIALEFAGVTPSTFEQI